MAWALDIYCGYIPYIQIYTALIQPEPRGAEEVKKIAIPYSI